MKMNDPINTIFPLFFCLLLTSSLTGQRIYVDATQTATADGQSWATAFSDLRPALLAAQAGDSIWVAVGTYTPSSTGDRTEYYELVDSVKIFGGFTGTETAFSERDFTNNLTILSGEIGDTATRDDNSQKILFGEGLSAATVLDGFTIRAANASNADGSGSNDAFFRQGGALSLDANNDAPLNNPIISNCIFLDNSSEIGGAVYISSLNQNTLNYPGFRNCTFQNNSASSQGGAIYTRGTAPEDGWVFLDSCTFLNNFGLTKGSAVALDFPIGRFEINNCHFGFQLSNTINNGSVHFTGRDRSGLALNNCSFVSNQSCAVSFLTLAAPPNPEVIPYLEIDGCIFDTNEIQAINATGISTFNFQCRNSVFKGHTGAVNQLNPIHIQYNAFFQPPGTVLFDGCQFLDNKAPDQGVLTVLTSYNSSSLPKMDIRILNAVFAGNDRAIHLKAQGGSNAAIISNCTFYDQSEYSITNNNSGQIIVENSIFQELQLPMLLDLFPNGGITVNHSLLSTPDCQNGNCGDQMFYAIDPLFRDTLNRDFRLASCSPLINMGQNAILDSLNAPQDAAQAPRILQGTVDLGAYEQYSTDVAVSIGQFFNPLCYGDSNGGVVFMPVGSPPYSYAWGDQVNTTGEIDSLSAGTYHFTFTDGNGCQDSVLLDLYEPDSIEITSTMTPATGPMDANGSLSVTNITGGLGFYELEWETGVTTSTIDGLLPGDYQVYITDEGGCTRVFVLTVDFNSTVTAVLPADWQVFPNPVSAGDLIHIKAGADLHLVSAFQTNGQCVLRRQVDQSSLQLDTKHWQAGLYTLLLQTADGRGYSARVVVE